MLVSTKGRYALRVMVDIAQRKDEGYLSLKDIAKRQDISMKYLEMIISLLSKAGLVVSRRGKDGGYNLAKPAEEYTAYEILSAAEGSLIPIDCPSLCGIKCEKACDCTTLPMWDNLNRTISDYLKSVSLSDLAEGNVRTL